MAVSATTFKAKFPEFSEVADAVIDPKLTDAQSFLDEGAFGETARYELAVYYYAAALLVDSPFGLPMGMTETISAQGNRYRRIYQEQILPLIRRRMQISGGGLT